MKSVLQVKIGITMIDIFGLFWVSTLSLIYFFLKIRRREIG